MRPWTFPEAGWGWWIRGILGILVVLWGFPGSAWAHFQMIIPSDDMVRQDEPRKITLDLRFWHPFEGYGLDMPDPARFEVVVSGKSRVNLKDKLQEVFQKDVLQEAHKTFQVRFPLRRPGDYTFVVETQPYWEPAEELFKLQYAKVVVNAFGLEKGWDQEVGLKAEIVPLSRPYGLYVGNTFRGIFKVEGKPVPFARVEVEFFNASGSLEAPADPLVTQVVKTDANGVFTYSFPWSGWWGFLALSREASPRIHEGKPYPVEIGGVIWVFVHEPLK